MKLPQVIFLVIMLLANAVNSAECVILLHGLAKTNQSMTKIAQNLYDEGYVTVNYDYPSRESSIQELAKDHINKALESCAEHTRIHFVTHSMGGILVRQYLSNNSISKLGKVVMLGPPNQGSEVVDKFHRLPGYALFGGPAALQLGTTPDSLPVKLGPANFELGIIAGSRSLNLLLSSFIPNQDDGKVSVINTKLAGMNDHIILPVTHPFMMKNNMVIAQVKHFLKSGVFASRTHYRHTLSRR
jgi:hypothetical protein